MTESINKLINLLELSEDDVLRALLSVYSPCQPGAIRQAWNNRKNYGTSPSTQQIWSLYEKYDFRCAKCKGQYKISIDHIDNNKHNSDLKNLQILCQSCNRSKQKRGVKNKDMNVKVYKSLIELSKSDTFPTTDQIFKNAKSGANGGQASAVLKFLIHRMKQLSLKLNAQ